MGYKMYIKKFVKALMLFIIFNSFLCYDDGLFTLNNNDDKIVIDVFICDTIDIFDTMGNDSLSNHLLKIHTVRLGERVDFISFINTNSGSLKLRWDFGDGNIKDGKIDISHTYSTAGNYKVIFSIIDSENFVLSDTVNLKVEAVNGSAIEGCVFYDGKKNHDSISVIFMQAGIEKYKFLTNSIGIYQQAEHFNPGIYDIIFKPLKFENYPNDLKLLDVSVESGKLNKIDNVILEDNYKPHILNYSPLNTIKDRKPVITAVFIDSCSGIAPKSFELFLNGVAISESLYTVDENKFIWNLTNKLSDKEHEVIARVCDYANNIDSVSWKFKVDGMTTKVIDDTVISINTELKFTASVSNVYSSITEYRWDYDGDNIWDDTIYTNDSSFVCKHIYRKSGNYKAVFFLKDNELTVKYDTVNIEVRNQNPKILNVNSDTIISINDSIIFYVTAIDSDGVIEKCEWDLNDDGIYEILGKGLVGGVAKFTKAGDNFAYLRLTDDDGKITEKTITIYVEQDIPKAFIKGDSIVAINEVVTFTDSVYQKFGSIVMFKWDNGISSGWNDSSSTLSSIDFIYNEIGDYVVRLFVRDDDGNEDSTTFNLTVFNDKPIITSSMSDTVVSINDTVVLKIDANDLNGIKYYCWDFGDGYVDTTKVNSIKHVYNNLIGTFSPIVTVLDSFNAYICDSSNVVIIEDIPKIHLSSDHIMSINDTIKISGYIENNFGSLLSLQWSLAGSSYENVPIKDTVDTMFLAPADTGNYNYILKVTDDDGFTGYDTVNISVVIDKPLVKVIASKTDVSINDTVILKNVSSDKYGKVKKWEWKIGESSWNETSENDTSIIVPNVVCMLLCSLRVTDDDGVTNVDTAKIFVKQYIPTVTIISDAVFAVNDTVRLDAEAKDSLGFITKWEWQINEGSWQETVDGKFSFIAASVESSYTCNVRITDDDGNTATANRKVWFSKCLFDYQGETSPRLTTACIVFNDKIWTIGGKTNSNKSYINDIYSSINGVDWILENANPEFEDRIGNSCVVFNGKLWNIGGKSNNDSMTFNDVCVSSDGVNWMKVVSNAPFKSRWGHSSIVYDNKIWVIGGMNLQYGYLDTLLNDVWYSEDGLNWNQATDKASFSARIGHSTVVFNDSLYLLCGGGNPSGGYETFSDVWSSKNGKDWNLVSESSGYYKRVGQQAFVYDNKIWMIGGITGNSFTISDIWNSDNGNDWSVVTFLPGFMNCAWHNTVIYENKLWVLFGIDRNSFDFSDLISDVWYKNLDEF